MYYIVCGGAHVKNENRRKLPSGENQPKVVHMVTYYIRTFGCKTNQYDGQVLHEMFARAGSAEAADAGHADFVIVNGCCVTRRACAKVRKFVHATSRDNPRARIIVTGCYARTPGDELDKVAGACVIAPSLEDVAAAAGIPKPAAGQCSITSFAGRQRAFLKVQEGCNALCTYCIVPQVRGRSRSKPPELVCREALDLCCSGFAEIVLTGTHLGLYGQDLDGRWTLAELLRNLKDSGVTARLRLSSIEINEVTREIVELICEGVLCPHLHIPLQSGSRAVLERMKRPYTPTSFLERLSEVCRESPDVVVTTDVMVGFPGETDEDFARTVQLAGRARFASMHIFPFCAREGTEAASMPQALPAGVIRERKRRLAELEDELARAAMKRFVGHLAHMLVEKTDGSTGFVEGTTEQYFKVRAAGIEASLGAVLPVRLGVAEGRIFTAVGA